MGVPKRGTQPRAMARTPAAKRSAVLALLVLLAGALVACGDDSPVKPPPAPPAPPGPESLTKREHVLERLGQVYATRDTSGYADLLDSGQYAFRFARTSGTFPTLVTMNRAADILATWTLFTHKGDSLEAESIDVSVRWQGAPWTELKPDTAAGRLTSWWSTTVVYVLNIRLAGGWSLLTFGLPRAQFTVRRNADGKWRMVNWLDLGTGGGVLRVNRESGVGEEINWGDVKDLYLSLATGAGGKGP